MTKITKQIVMIKWIKWICNYIKPFQSNQNLNKKIVNKFQRQTKKNIQNLKKMIKKMKNHKNQQKMKIILIKKSKKVNFIFQNILMMKIYGNYWENLDRL